MFFRTPACPAAVQMVGYITGLTGSKKRPALVVADMPLDDYPLNVILLWNNCYTGNREKTTWIINTRLPAI